LVEILVLGGPVRRPTEDSLFSALRENRGRRSPGCSAPTTWLPTALVPGAWSRPTWSP